MTIGLAQSSIEHAERTGLLLGMLVLLGFLGVTVLGTVCIVKAFTRRTTGWVVAGSISGVFLALVLAVFIIGIVKATEASRGSGDVEPVDSQTQSGSSADSLLSSPATQIVRGGDIAYSIRVPVAWTTKRDVEDFDTLSSHKSAVVGIIAEEADLGSPDVIADVARKSIAKHGTDIQWSDPVPLTLDGREWLQFRVDCKVESVPLSYRYFVYAGHEGTFQVIGWTFQNLFERDASKIREVMESFHFPE